MLMCNTRHVAAKRYAHTGYVRARQLRILTGRQAEARLSSPVANARVNGLPIRARTTTTVPMPRRSQDDAYSIYAARCNDRVSLPSSSLLGHRCLRASPARSRSSFGVLKKARNLAAPLHSHYTIGVRYKALFHSAWVNRSRNGLRRDRAWRVH